MESFAECEPFGRLAAVNRLLAWIDRLTAYSGPLHPSPLFGTLSHDEAVALQLAHCAHHLSFLEPKQLPGATDPS